MVFGYIRSLYGLITRKTYVSPISEAYIEHNYTQAQLAALAATLEHIELWPVNISVMTPLDWALPLYGLCMPGLIFFTTFVNCFILIILSHKHLLTPTNVILYYMAVTDLLTGFCALPWFVFYYTLNGYKIDLESGLNVFWCHAHSYMFESFPSIFHNTAIILTVYLAIQRYWYVRKPYLAQRGSPTDTRLRVWLIILGSIIAGLPEVLGKRRVTVKIGKNECYIAYRSWVMKSLGKDLYYSLYYWFRVILHGVPCILLLLFTGLLMQTIRASEIRKKSLINHSMLAYQEKLRNDGVLINGKPIPKKKTRSMHTTNRMLATICGVFLALEIPAVVVYIFHFLVAKKYMVGDEAYYFLIVNRLLVIRNVLIVFASPIQFGIYVSMSESFRLTVKQLFTSRTIFIVNEQHYTENGKRNTYYSLTLVDKNDDIVFHEPLFVKLTACCREKRMVEGPANRKPYFEEDPNEVIDVEPLPDDDPHRKVRFGDRRNSAVEAVAIYQRQCGELEENSVIVTNRNLSNANPSDICNSPPRSCIVQIHSAPEHCNPLQFELDEQEDEMMETSFFDMCSEADDTSSYDSYEEYEGIARRNIVDYNTFTQICNGEENLKIKFASDEELEEELQMETDPETPTMKRSEHVRMAYYEDMQTDDEEEQNSSRISSKKTASTKEDDVMNDLENIPYADDENASLLEDTQILKSNSVESSCPVSSAAEDSSHSTRLRAPMIVIDFSETSGYSTDENYMEEIVERII